MVSLLANQNGPFFTFSYYLLHAEGDLLCISMHINLYNFLHAKFKTVKESTKLDKLMPSPLIVFRPSFSTFKRSLSLLNVNYFITGTVLYDDPVKALILSKSTNALLEFWEFPSFSLFSYTLVTVPLAKVKFVLAISISWFLSSWDKVLMQVNQSESGENKCIFH